MNNALTPLLTSLAYQFPLVLIQIVGIVLALVYWKRCPGPSLLAVLAFSLLILTGLIQTFINVYLFRVARESWNWSWEQIDTMMMATSIIMTLLRAVAMVMLVAAIFMGRSAVTVRGRNRD